MKHLKTFENINTHLRTQKEEPKVGDYVICKEIYSTYPDVKKFTINNIGTIISTSEPYPFVYLIAYENVPYNIKYYFENDTLYMSFKEIVEYSENKEDLEAILAANKYNL